MEKKDTDRSRLVGGHKRSRSLHLPARILKVYRDLNWVQSHTECRYPQHTFYLKAVSLKQLLEQRRQVEHTFQGEGREWGAQVHPAHGSTGEHVFLVTSSNT